MARLSVATAAAHVAGIDPLNDAPTLKALLKAFDLNLEAQRRGMSGGDLCVKNGGSEKEKVRAAKDWLGFLILMNAVPA